MGLTLKSAMVQGQAEGGAILVLEAKHKYISGSIQFNNTQSEELGRQLGQKVSHSTHLLVSGKR